VDDWVAFILKRQVYGPGRTQSPEQREAKERKAMNRNGRQQGRRNLANGDSDAEKLSLGAERKERILRLRLSNEMRRSKLQQLCESTITIGECEASMERLRAVVGGDLLKLPVSLCHQLAGRNPQYIQQLLTSALRSSLERLSRPENYL
jgi:hypothetical protein